MNGEISGEHMQMSLAGVIFAWGVFLVTFIIPSMLVCAWLLKEGYDGTWGKDSVRFMRRKLFEKTGKRIVKIEGGATAFGHCITWYTLDDGTSLYHKELERLCNEK